MPQKRLAPKENANEVIDLCHLNEEERIDATDNLRDILDSMEGVGMHTAEEKNPIENFDDYLDTLEDILAISHTDVTPFDHVTPATSMDNKMKCCKKKFSSFLAVDFLSLGNIKEVDKLLTDLEEKKLKVSSLKNEYIELKDKVTQREAKMDGLVLNIQEIDD
ncbi:hypothetical protein JHK82_050044 [Glycine max]|nr:hypothetical protein JHK86_049918 [Glycine max]KAG4935770.1 hypothetical protein JHK85_050689 [Glycine max]KAG5091266.1 hypothetical protein JHK82_050044 [Glycine max]